MKILNLILSVKKQPWIVVEDVIRETFYTNRGNIDVKFFYGNCVENCHTDDSLYLTSIEDVKCAKKTIDAFKYCLDNFDFDIIFRSNTSSYIDYGMLTAEAETVKRYAGVIGTCNEVKFASGCGFFITRDMVKLVVDNYKNLDFTQFDDVMIGKFLNSCGIYPEPKNRIDVDENTYNVDLNCFHYRCKPINVDYCNFVINAFKKLHKLKN